LGKGYEIRCDAIENNLGINTCDHMLGKTPLSLLESSGPCTRAVVAPFGSFGSLFIEPKIVCLLFILLFSISRDGAQVVIIHANI